jgi:predicted aspartyl protease
MPQPAIFLPFSLDDPVVSGMRVGSASARALFLACLLDAATSIEAIHLNVVGRHELRKRATHVSGLSNGQNIDYATNITLNGQAFSVLIDTGRSAIAITLRHED